MRDGRGRWTRTRGLRYIWLPRPTGSYGSTTDDEIGTRDRGCRRASRCSRVLAIVFLSPASGGGPVYAPSRDSRFTVAAASRCAAARDPSRMVSAAFRTRKIFLRTGSAVRGCGGAAIASSPDIDDGRDIRFGGLFALPSILRIRRFRPRL